MPAKHIQATVNSVVTHGQPPAASNVRHTVQVIRGTDVVVDAHASTHAEAHAIAERELRALHRFELDLLLSVRPAEPKPRGLTNAEIRQRPCPTCRVGAGVDCRRRSLGPDPYEEYPPMTAGDGDAHFHRERLA